MPDIRYVIAAIAQLERDLIVERVRNGLKNAKMKGKVIGRKKTRPSELIRTLLEKGLPLRTIASIAGTSHGSVSLEKRLWKQERVEAERKKLDVEMGYIEREMFPS